MDTQEMKGFLKLFPIGCPDFETVFYAGWIETYKRERGYTEEDLLLYEQILKHPEECDEIKEESGASDVECLEAYRYLRFRRRDYKRLKKIHKSNKKKQQNEDNDDGKSEEKPEEVNN